MINYTSQYHHGLEKYMEKDNKIYEIEMDRKTTHSLSNELVRLPKRIHGNGLRKKKLSREKLNF